MANFKNYRKNISDLTSIKRMVEAYEEIAAIRMRKVRKSVLNNREFLDGLSTVHGQVRSVYLSQHKLKGKKDTLVARKTNGKSVYLLITANTGLYGSLLKDLFEQFRSEVPVLGSEIVVVGRLGKKYFDSYFPDFTYKYFDFSDTGKDEENAKLIYTYLLEYENIVVYHGIFKNILSQVPSKTVVAGQDVIAYQKSDNSKSYQEQKSILEHSIYEPSIEDILSFFEKQILGAIFEQSFYESSLSKFASRMINLDFANVNLHKAVKDARYKLLLTSHKVSNVRQNSLLSSISLWGSQ